MVDECGDRHVVVAMRESRMVMVRIITSCYPCDHSCRRRQGSGRAMGGNGQGLVLARNHGLEGEAEGTGAVAGERRYWWVW